jgi:tetratricopeptide (TPR) repeat protein
MPRCDREVQHTLFRCEIVTEHAYFTLSRGCYDTIDDLPDPEAFPKLGDIPNVVSQEAWRMAKAMVLADRGEFTEAERLVREVVDLAMGGDALDDQGEALSARAQVLVAAGPSEEAAALLREAIDRYERKGNVVSAAGARERLAALIEETDP